MGWWSATILGGDTPLDLLHVIEERIGWDHKKHQEHGLYPVDCWSKYKRKQVKDLLSDLEKMKAALSFRSLYSENNCIYFQVLAVIVMTAGATMPDELRKKALNAARKDEWAATGDEDRVKHINKLIANIKAYDGTPIATEEKGLFEKINELMGG